MARTIDRTLAKWLRASSGRSASYMPVSKGYVKLSLRGWAKSESHIVEVVCAIPDMESRISGGGSAPTAIQLLIDEWNAAAGFALEFSGGAR